MSFILKNKKWKTFLFAGLIFSTGQALAVPAGADSSITTVEETPITLTLADFGFSDPDGYTFQGVTFPLQPSTGVITVNGSSIISPQYVTAANIAAGLVAWRPALNSAGVAASSVSFSVQNSNGAMDPTLNILALNVNPVNDPPLIDFNLIKNGTFSSVLANWTITGNINYSYGGMGFNTGDTVPNGVGEQTIATQPGASYTVEFSTLSGGIVTMASRLRLDAVDVTTSAVLATVNTFQNNTAGVLNFTATGANTIIRIVDISTATNSTDIALTKISAARTDAAPVTYEDSTIVWSVANNRPLKISDVDGTTGIYTLSLSATQGILTLATTAGLTISAGADNSSALTINGTQADINAALEGLVYTPNADYNGAATLSLVVNDNGNIGTGSALSSSHTIPLTVLPVNDAPSGADKTITVNEDTAYSLTAADFGFVDAPVDSPANTFNAVVITTQLAGSGTLTLSGVPVAAGQIIPVTSIPNLVWTPAPQSHGMALSSFTFQVQDNGGRANGGADLDSSPNRITFNVTAVNDPPVAVDDAYTVAQGGTVALSLLVNDTDPDGDTLLVGSINGTAITVGVAQTIAVPNGTVTVSAAGAISFTAAAGYLGSTSFDYVVSDGNGGTDTGTVTVSIVAAPVAVPLGGGWFVILLSALLAGLGSPLMQNRRRT